MSKTTRDRYASADDAAEWPVSYDPTDETYHTRCDVTNYEPASTAVLMAVASVHGTEPDDLELLSGSIDPDALNAIIVRWYEADSRAGDGSITFSFAECTVTAHADGEIVIDPNADGGDLLER